MTAFNTVRFKVKPGRDRDFLEAHQAVERNWPGLRHANMIKTGEGTYCIIGEWDDMESLADARPFMLATLDTFRDLLDGETGSVSPSSKSRNVSSVASMNGRASARLSMSSHSPMMQ